MTRLVSHALALRPTADELAGQDFVSAVRGHILNDMAASMKQRWAQEIAPSLASPARDGGDVHRAMRTDPYFRFYSALRVHAQEMVWHSVGQAVERDAGRLEKAARAVEGRAGGTLELDPDLPMPATVMHDVHWMPGSYAGGESMAAGALYENGLGVFSFGLMGRELDDIGRSVTAWLRARYPDFAPRDILDLGCTVGHQTLPWKHAYGHARVTGIDVAAPCLRYAHARAEALGVTAHFAQRDARHTGYPDHSYDLVFSSMFLHELPPEDVRAVYQEARRLLRPGGLMLHYELPPNAAVDPYDGFYLDWDSFYNAEPWYKAYRDLDPRALAREAGFAPENYLQAVVPSLAWYGEDALTQDEAADDQVGRLADGVKWFVHGAWA